ncbi:hypothetical protein BGZ76_002300 [Entomortierella beljakovae]|nr:hypothetical protein BGZ76_002300 [Entomortierella beljakovae]
MPANNGRVLPIADAIDTFDEDGLPEGAATAVNSLVFTVPFSDTEIQSPRMDIALEEVNQIPWVFYRVCRLRTTGSGQIRATSRRHRHHPSQRVSRWLSRRYQNRRYRNSEIYLEPVTLRQLPRPLRLWFHMFPVIAGNPVHNTVYYLEVRHSTVLQENMPYAEAPHRTSSQDFVDATPKNVHVIHETNCEPVPQFTLRCELGFDKSHHWSMIEYDKSCSEGKSLGPRLSYQQLMYTELPQHILE